MVLYLRGGLAMKKAVGIFLAIILMTGVLPGPATRAAQEVTFGKTIAQGYARAYAIQNDGSLWYWKGGGFNDTAEDFSPEYAHPAKLMDDVASVVAGEGGEAIITKTDGSIWFFGKGYAGDGSRYTDHKIPIQIPIDNVAAVSIGRSHYLVLKHDGTVWEWGTKSTAMSDGYYYPTKAMDDVIAISTGASNAFAIRSDHSLWGWGYNGFGQLAIVTERAYNFTPTKIMEDIKSVQGGNLCTYAIRSDDSLWGWGYRLFGTEVDDEYKENWPDGRPPVKILEDVKMTTGEGVAILNDASLWVWGHGWWGAFKAETNISSEVPQKVLSGVTDVVGNGNATLILMPDGTLLGGGAHAYWIFGLGDENDEFLAPTEIMKDVAIPGAVLSIPSAWAKEGVSSAIELGLVPDKLQRQYGANTTREEFCGLSVKLLETVSGKEISAFLSDQSISLYNPFADTENEAVIMMASLGVVSGVGDGTFNPQGELTREQAAKMLTILAKILGAEASETAVTFADQTEISAWACEYVSFVAHCGIMNGTGGNQFSPQAIYTREESILTILRLKDMASRK